VTQHDRTTQLYPEDRELVDLLTAVLVDPNVHTDLRMRLHRRVSAILRVVHEQLYAGSAGEVQPGAPEADDEHLPDLLTAVLVDPDLYTDLRMRLHRDIRAVLGAVRQPGPV
jgi:hypothetical protein